MEPSSIPQPPLDSVLIQLRPVTYSEPPSAYPCHYQPTAILCLFIQPPYCQIQWTHFGFISPPLDIAPGTVNHFPLLPEVLPLLTWPHSFLHWSWFSLPSLQVSLCSSNCWSSTWITVLCWHIGFNHQIHHKSPAQIPILSSRLINPAVYQPWSRRLPRKENSQRDLSFLPISLYESHQMAPLHYSPNSALLPPNWSPYILTSFNILIV